MNKASVKIYAIEFNEYTNYSKNCVSDGNGEYIDIDNGPFLIREDEIEKYRQFGDGIRTLTYVGTMIPDEKDDD